LAALQLHLKRLFAKPVRDLAVNVVPRTEIAVGAAAPAVKVVVVPASKAAARVARPRAGVEKAAAAVVAGAVVAADAVVAVAAHALRAVEVRRPVKPCQGRAA
jgi:hypothetical protein